MAGLIATTIARGSSPAQSDGSVFLVNLETDRVLRPILQSAADPRQPARVGARGFRGIAMHGEHVYVAASDELMVFDHSFQVVAAHRNRYLSDCQSISIHGHHLFLASAAYDSILGFNLAAGSFDWALRLVTDGRVHAARPFDPHGDDGPLEIDKLQLNSLYCCESGMYISGARTGALLRFGGRAIGVMATLPEGAHDAMPHLDGILFNDSRSNAVRFESAAVSIALPVPRPGPQHPIPAGRENPRNARAESCCGLCILPDGTIAAGSTPASITVYDLALRQPVKVINLSRDVRNAIHTIRVWPHAWPGG